MAFTSLMLVLYYVTKAIQWSLYEPDEGFTVVNSLPTILVAAADLTLIVVLSYHGYQGRKLRLPGLARLADRYA